MASGGWNKGIDSNPLCKHCGETKRSMFYKKNKTNCKKCQAKITEKKRVANRELLLEYKGGKCEHCGYNRYRGALEFHHKDPAEKDPTGLRKRSLDALKKEVDKCVLLCANCHREEHARMEERI